MISNGFLQLVTPVGAFPICGFQMDSKPLPKPEFLNTDTQTLKAWGLGFKVYGLVGLWFRAWGLRHVGFRAQGLGFRVWWVQGLRFRALNRALNPKP